MTRICLNCEHWIKNEYGASRNIIAAEPIGICKQNMEITKDGDGCRFFDGKAMIKTEQEVTDLTRVITDYKKYPIQESYEFKNSPIGKGEPE